jgi:hypothetical protein
MAGVGATARGIVRFTGATSLPAMSERQPELQCFLPKGASSPLHRPRYLHDWRLCFRVLFQFAVVALPPMTRAQAVKGARSSSLQP